MDRLEGKDFWQEHALRRWSVLVEKAHSDDAMERWAVTFALGDLDTAESRRLLVHLGQDPDPNVAQAASATLIRLQRRDERAPERRRAWTSAKRMCEERREAVLREERSRLVALLRDPRALVRAAAARRLGEIADESSAATLVDLLSTDSEPIVRMAAVWSLGALGKPGAAEFVCDALSDEDAGVRASAAAALGQFCDVECAEALAEVLLSDEDSTVRFNACASLADCAGVVESRGNQRGRVFVVSEAAIDALRQAADADWDDDVRELAAEVLLELDDLEETTGNGSSTVLV